MISSFGFGFWVELDRLRYLIGEMRTCDWLLLHCLNLSGLCGCEQRMRLCACVSFSERPL